MKRGFSASRHHLFRIRPAVSVHNAQNSFSQPARVASPVISAEVFRVASFDAHPQHPFQEYLLVSYLYKQYIIFFSRQSFPMGRQRCRLGLPSLRASGKTVKMAGRGWISLGESMKGQKCLLCAAHAEDLLIEIYLIMVIDYSLESAGIYQHVHPILNYNYIA